MPPQQSETKYQDQKVLAWKDFPLGQMRRRRMKKLGGRRSGFAKGRTI